MQQDLNRFFREMKEQDNRTGVPSFEECVRKPPARTWAYAAAAVITLTAVMLIFINNSPWNEAPTIRLDTGNSPTVTNTLASPGTEEFLDWEAPTDYLSNDFNP